MGLKSFYKKNKGAIIGSVIPGVGTAAGMAYDQREAKKRAEKKQGKIMDAIHGRDIAYTWGGLGEEMDRYKNVSSIARQSALDDSKRAGTYSADAGFERGLISESGARERALRKEYINRINAIRARLGLEEFKE